MGKVELIIKNLPTKSNPDPDVFAGRFYQAYRKEIIQILPKGLCKNLLLVSRFSTSSWFRVGILFVAICSHPFLLAYPKYSRVFSYTAFHSCDITGHISSFLSGFSDLCLLSFFLNLAKELPA